MRRGRGKGTGDRGAVDNAPENDHEQCGKQELDERPVPLPNLIKMDEQLKKQRNGEEGGD